jgi:lipoprotein-anchoring transpeptidase ErfK/SrfK
MRRLLLVVVALALSSVFALATAHTARAEGPWTGWIESDEAYVRADATTDSEILGALHVGDTITVGNWVIGEYAMDNNNIWAEIGPGEYVYTASINRGIGSEPPTPPDWAFHEGKWIDVNLTQQIVTAYWGNDPQNWMLASTGRPGFETPTGEFNIEWRIYDEWMGSETLFEESDYYSHSHVYYTQYFTTAGNAFHYNYWKDNSPFGVPTSHGCVGLMYDDAEWLWNFADEGTPVVIHY